MLEFEDDINETDPSTMLEEEIEILDEAYRNAYAIATGRISIKELLEKSPDMIFLPFDPSAPETFKMVIDDIIKYFEDNEEYEKCAELVSAKDNHR